MKFTEHDLVRVTVLPPLIRPESSASPHHKWLNRVGFIDFAEIRRPRGPGRNPKGPGGIPRYQVGILSDTGLEEIVTLPECYLTLDDSEDAKKLYADYQETLNSIQKEADERQRQMAAVISHLSIKYKIAPDEIHGIYKAVLNYQEYYKDRL